MALVKEHMLMVDTDKKREDIREGIKEVLFEQGVSNRGHIARLIMEKEASQGVVIKVDRELPIIGAYLFEHEKTGYEDAQRVMEEAGYVATEPLIDKG